MDAEFYINKLYPAWVEKARRIASVYRVFGVGADVLNDVLTEMLGCDAMFSQFRQSEKSVEQALTSYVMGAVVKKLLLIRTRGYDSRICDLFDNCFAMPVEESEREADEIFKVRREAEAKRRDDSFGGYCPATVEELPFIPTGMYMSEYNAVRVSPNGKPQMSVGYSLITYAGKGKQATKRFSTKHAASMYRFGVLQYMSKQLNNTTIW